MLGCESAATALRLALEARERIRIGAQMRRQDFDRDIAIQLRVARAIDLAHATRTEGLKIS